MTRIPFQKFQSLGNDFIVFDSSLCPRILLEKNQDNIGQFVKKVCDRHYGVGADGILVYEDMDLTTAFKMHIYNNDGSRASMCGNGANCLILYHALKTGTASVEFKVAGGKTYQGECSSVGTKLFLNKPPHTLKAPIDEYTSSYLDTYFINTGVPHLVLFLENADTLKHINVLIEGRTFRNLPCFQEGANVNFIAPLPGQNFRNSKNFLIRTYERGVEAETNGCGTGILAAAIAVEQKFGKRHSCQFATPGGLYGIVHFDDPQKNSVSYQTNPELIFTGEISYPGF